MTLRYIESVRDLTPEDLEQDFVVVEESPAYPRQLVFVHKNQGAFRKQYQEFLSRFHILRDTSLWTEFISQLESDGVYVYTLPSATRVVEENKRFLEPLKVGGFGLDLFPFQQYGLRQAFSLIGEEDYFFFNAGTGMGKTIIAAAGAQELIANQGRFDLMIAFTMAKIMHGYAGQVSTHTGLQARVIDLDKKKRIEEFAKEDAQVYVMNYEKSFFDFDILKNLIKGKRVIFVLDEVQRILTYGERKSRRATYTNKLFKYASEYLIWPMSATVIDQDPIRFHRVFQWVKTGNPLGTVKEYESQYLDRVELAWVQRGSWGYEVVEKKWNHRKLEEVRHRVAPHSISLRKTDPGVRELFKGIQFEILTVEMSDSDRKLYEFFSKMAKDAQLKEDFELAAYAVHCMKIVCTSAEGLLKTKNPLPKELLKVGHLKIEDLKTSLSAKCEVVLDKIEEIKDQGDKVVLFTKYTNLGLFLLEGELQRRKLTYVINSGEQSSKQSAEAQNSFNSDPRVTVFASSDAGTYGLNLQASRYVINYEVPRSYDELMQRNSRIDRADSHLDGLTCYGYVYNSTMEEKNLRVMETRREMAEVIQGTREALSRPELERFSGDKLSIQDELELIFSVGNSI